MIDHPDEELPVFSPPPPWHHGTVGSLVVSIGGFVLYFLVGHLAMGFVLIGVLMGRGIEITDQQAVEAATIEFIPVIVSWATAVSIAMIAVGKKMRLLEPRPAVEIGRPGIVAWVVGASVITVLGSHAIDLLLNAVGWEVTEQPAMLEALEHPTLGLIIAITLTAPIGEELIFRRFLFSNLKVGIGRGWAYAIPAVLFGLVHLNPTAFVIYIWLAVCLTLTYERTGSVIAAMVVHGLNNAAAVIQYQLL